MRYGSGNHIEAQNLLSQSYDLSYPKDVSITKANRNDTFAFVYESTVALRFILRGSYEVLE
jgi:hypothetical protein